MVDHDVVGLDVSVSYTLRVAVIERLENLEHVVSDVEVSETLVECSEVNIPCIYVLHDQGGGLCHWVSHDVNQVDDIHTIL